jgi:hypothetical protein
MALAADHHVAMDGDAERLSDCRAGHRFVISPAIIPR